jgi:hypothetical protein
MHALLFLLMHFTAGGPPRGEEYRSYLIHNTEHSDRTFYWSAGTIDLPEIPQGRQRWAAYQIDTPFPASRTEFALH